MRLSTLGRTISQAEVTNIDQFGLWIIVQEKEYFLSYEEFPWFRNVKVDDILNVKLLHDNHLHWPALDVDLSVDSLEKIEAYPLTYK